MGVALLEGNSHSRNVPRSPPIYPRAYLRRIKNVKRGVSTRSRIIDALKQKPLTVSELAELMELSPSTIRRHLRNMSREGIVLKFKSERKRLWKLTGIGQTALEEVIA